MTTTTTNLFSLCSGGWKAQIKVSAKSHFIWRLWGESFLASSTFLWQLTSPDFLGLCPHHSILCLSSHCFLLCVCLLFYVSILSVDLKSIQVIQDYLLITRSLITPTKTLFPKMVTFTGSRISDIDIPF